MKSGLLWYDNDPRRALEDKIGQAAQRYHEKHGHWPNTCFVHPQAMSDRTEEVLRIPCPVEKNRTVIQVMSASNVLLHHFWLGQSANQAGKTPKRATQ
jgi:hypothetical protein